MKKVLLGVTMALAGGTVIAGDQNFDNRWYVKPNVSVTKPDTDKNISSGLEMGLAVGKFLTEKVSLDFELAQGTMDSKSGGELEQRTYGLIGRYHFTENTGFTPYLGLGFGVMNSTLDTSQDNRQATGSFIGGLSKALTDNVHLKTELRYRMENADDSIRPRDDKFGDFLFNAGLAVMLGEKSTESTKTDLIEQAPIDSDKDGVSDAKDRCPSSPSGSNVDGSGCAIVDNDDDNDGVPNSKDACPNSKAGAVVGSDGCEVQVVIELQGVHFDTDKATLKPESIAILNAAVKTLGEHGTILVEVAGHTDSTASDAYNKALSDRRAKVVYSYLVDHGVAADRMTWKGYGESQPIATNDTEAGKAKNRRTELIVK